MNSQKWFCKSCGSEETIFDKQYGLRLSEIEGLNCPVCLAKGKHHKMYKIIEDCTKLREGDKKMKKTSQKEIRLKLIPQGEWERIQ